MQRETRIGADAIAARGWLRAHKWLLLRRASQITVMALFLLGPLAGLGGTTTGMTTTTPSLLQTGARLGTAAALMGARWPLPVTTFP